MSKRSQLIGNTAIVRKRRVIHKKSTCVCLRLSVAAFTRKRRDARFDLWPALVSRVANVLRLRLVAGKAGHRSNLASLRFRVNVATERRYHTQVDFLWITQLFRTIAVFPINWERLDAGVFTSMLPATKRKSRTFATRETKAGHRSNFASLRFCVNAATERR